MTAAEQLFRSSTDKRVALKECIEAFPILMEALGIASEIPTESSDGLTPTGAAVRLGEIQATQRFVSKLLALTEPIIQPQTQPPETFGTPYSVADFDKEPV